MIRILLGFIFALLGLWCLGIVYGDMNWKQMVGMFLLLVAGGCMKLERHGGDEGLPK